MVSTQARLLERVVAPASEPVSLSEAKQYLRVEHAADDTLISQLIIAARQMAERFLRRSLITQSWRYSFNGSLEEETRLPYGPIQSVTSVTLVDSAGTETILSNSAYRLDATKEFLLANAFFSSDKVKIEYAAGYGNAADVPSPIRQGILIHVACLYDNRDSGGDIPHQSLALYGSYKEMAL